MEVNFFWNVVYRMPRKPRITAVPVEQEEGLMIAMDAPDEKTDAEHEKTDAEQMTEIIKEERVAKRRANRRAERCSA